MCTIDGTGRKKDRSKTTWSHKETSVFLEYIKANGPENHCVSRYLAVPDLLNFINNNYYFVLD